IKGAVENLPDLTPEESSTLAATGTDGGTHKGTLAPYLLHSGDGLGGFQRVADVMTDSDAPSCMMVSLPENEASDRLQPITGGGNRTHTGVTPQRILSPQRLPFRHAGALVTAGA